MNPAPTNFAALQPATLEVLNALAEQPVLQRFTLVGGTGLSLYLAHRQSEDLDFFSWEPVLPKTAIQQMILRDFPDAQQIADFEHQSDWIIRQVKVTFSAQGWAPLKENRLLLKEYIFVASLDLIAATKVNTLFLRAKFRDYYDLYSLVNQGFEIERLFNVSKQFFPSLSEKLFQIALIFTDDIEEDHIGYLSPMYKVKKPEISRFFEKRLKEWLKSAR